MKLCPTCGSGLNPESKFCHTCGADINWDEQEPATQSQPEQGVSEDPELVNQVSWTINNEVYPGQTNIFDRVKNILLNPKQEWSVIMSEMPDKKKIILSYVCILSLIPAVSALLGYGLQGYWMKGIREGLVEFLVYVTSVILITRIVDLLAPSFQSEVNSGRSLQLVAYSFTPGMVGGILLLMPSLSPFVFLISLYSIYLMYTGIHLLKKTPAESVSGYVGITIVTIILVSMILSFLFTVIVGIVL